ncbi:MAG: hypothetical protein DRP84_12105 [Spirochaetes bacterium]|nr:MAG: hypothetical protein DRP84_12105 [Spirochaetota bacterium]
MDNIISNISKEFPLLPTIDLHYYAMKAYGIYDEAIVFGRPKFHLIGSDKLFSVVPLISSPYSPYVFKNGILTYMGVELPFRVKFIGRITRSPAYFYIRGIKEWMPTLESETILSINFHPICKGCEWCCREIGKGMRNISPEEGMEIIQSKGIGLHNIDKITFVTGMYRNEDEVISSLIKVIELAKDKGFNGRLLYIGSQIKTAHQINKLLGVLGNTPFKYAYTLETFTSRERMHNKKNTPLEYILSTLDSIKRMGVMELEYSYMPGLDSLAHFKTWMPRFSRLAIPHISIFRPAEPIQENLKNHEFVNNPLGYLCSMRFAFEKEHGGPIFQNNLASLWGMPIKRINPLFLTDAVALR